MSDTQEADDRSSMLSSSAIMAAGTVVSRLSGFVRSSLLAAALGFALHADLFTIANTIPNSLYILLAGGVFNAVLVPQLVRAMRGGREEGEAYTSRVITLAALFLLTVTVLLVVFAPALMRIYLDGRYYSDPTLSAQRESAIMLARLCLPQVFFYGMFVLLGQVLNARGTFGPMMWAPIANNVISVAVLVVYLVVFGAAVEGDTSAYSTGQELLLGVGSTLGILAQLVILVPYVRSTGYRFRPRFDFRGTGLGHTLRLGSWTVGFVIANQIAYAVVVKLASGGTAATAGGGGAEGTGYTIYSNAFLLIMVPHSVATVSLATAMLPRLSRAAAAADLRAVGRGIAETLRTTYALIVPFALLVPVVAPDLANIVWGWGAASETYRSGIPTLQLFAIGLVFFTAHYLVLRGFYALEQTRRVFWVQCVVAAVNIALALVLTSTGPASQTAPRLVLAYSGSYAVGAAISYVLLSRQVGGLATGRLVRFGVRVLIAAGLATVVALLVSVGFDQVWTGESKVRSVVVLATVGLVDGGIFLVLARLMRVEEITSILALVAARLPGGSRGGPRVGSAS